jgi:WD40 repeat protein
MSGLEYLLDKTLSNQSISEKAKKPENFQEALNEFLSFSEKQLPKIFEIDFMPICFDVSKDQKTLIIGGQHGNFATYDVVNKTLKDEDIGNEVQITTVLFALNEQQVIVGTLRGDIYFLSFPALKTLHRIELEYTPVVINQESGLALDLTIKLGLNEEWLYYTTHNNQIEIIKLSGSKNFYSKKFECNKIYAKDNILSFDISDDGTLIAMGLDTGFVSLLHCDTGDLLQSTKEPGQKPLIISFSPKRQYIAAGFEDFLIKVWNLDSTLSLSYEFNKHVNTITGILFVKDNRYMATSSSDHNIIIWDMKVECLPYTMNLFDRKVLHFKASTDYNTVYFSQTHNEILSWTIPTLHRNARYRKHTKKVNKIIFLPSSFEMLSIGDDGLAIIWDYRNDLFQESIELEGRLTNATISTEGKSVIICSSKPCIYRWDLVTGFYDEYEFLSEAEALCFSSEDYMLAISDSSNRVIVYDADVMERKHLFKGHKAPVTGLGFILNNTFLLTASKDTEICKWDMLTEEKVATFKGHKNSIVAMVISPGGWAISASDEAIIIWNLDGVQLYTMIAPLGRNLGIFLSEDETYMITLQENRVSYWQLDNLSIMFEIDTFYQGSCIAISNDQKMVAVGEGTTIYIEENPMHSSSNRLVGKTLGSRHKYMNFVIESQKKNSNALYNEIHNHWVFAPYMIGVSHILSFSNRIDDLNDALFRAENKAGYFSTIKAEDPLSLCVDLEYKNVIDVCLKHMKAEMQRKNIRAFASLEKCLTKLNTIEYPDIAKVYDIIFLKAEGSHLPDFCLHESEIPTLHRSDSIFIIPEEIVSKECFSSTGRPVVFYQSLCLLDIELGTAGSLEFLESLLNGDSQVYNSKIVKEFLNCKWNEIQYIVNIQGFVYILYMILLSIYTVSFMQNYNFLFLVIIAHFTLFCIEMLQLLTDYKNYWFDVWNIFDQLRTWSFHIYIFKVWYEENNEDKFSYDNLLAVIIFSWLRGISYFRMFNGTRYMVRLLGKVIMDMRVFFTILFYSTMGFALIFYLRNPTIPFWMYMTTSYRLDLGDFNTDYTAVFDWVVFFLATMMNPMIMLNLLISILSDTAATVSADNYVANLQELTRMIIEVERVMFWKKNVTKKHYLQFCNFIEDDPQTDKIIEKCKFIKQKLEKMQKKLENVDQKMLNVNINQIENTVKHIAKEQQDLKNEMIANFEKNNSILVKIGKKLQK